MSGDATHILINGVPDDLDPKYSKLSENVRHLVSNQKQCAMFCKGKTCKYCTVNQWSEQHLAIKGVYSNWITEDLLAMARPTTAQIDTILTEFAEHNIIAIFNMQTAGEHPLCGPSWEEESKFSYDPQTFMDKNIYFYNFAWEDYGITKMENILDICKVMRFTIVECQGRIAVHCHAGLGRTGTLIACYLCYAERINADQAINLVRAKRPNSIQTRSQLKCVRDFSSFLIKLWPHFALPYTPDVPQFSLQAYFTRQRWLMVGDDVKTWRFVPRILGYIARRLMQLAGRPATPPYANAKDAESLSNFSKQSSPAGSICDAASINAATEAARLAPDDAENQTACDELDKSANELDSSNCNGAENSSTELKEPQKKLGESGNSIVMMNEEVAVSLLVEELNDEERDTVEKLQQAVNESDYQGFRTGVLSSKMDVDRGFNAILEETSAVALGALLWRWLDHLQEPLLTPQSMFSLLSALKSSALSPFGLASKTGEKAADEGRSPGVMANPLGKLAWSKFDRGTRATTRLLANTIIALRPIPDEIEYALFQKLVSYLTQRSVEGFDADTMEQTAAGGDDCALAPSTTTVNGDIEEKLTENDGVQRQEEELVDRRRSQLKSDSTNNSATLKCRVSNEAISLRDADLTILFLIQLCEEQQLSR